MRKRTDKEIEDFISEMWKADSANEFSNFEIIIRREKETYKSKGKPVVYLSVTRQYEYVDVNFSKMKAIVDFFEAEDLDVDDHYSNGCDSCDYGSSYTKQFWVW